MGNPRNRTLDRRRRFAAIHASANKKGVEAQTQSDRRTEDTCAKRKRVRFAQGTDSLLESESDAKAKLSDATEAPKTSEYAFFKKLRQDAGRKTGHPVHKGNKEDECKSGDGSDNAGVGYITSQGFQNLKFSLRPQDERPAESSSLLSPIAGSSEAADHSPEQLDFRNHELSQPIKHATHAEFEISCSPFRDRVKSAVASYVYGQGNIFSTKRDRLLQLVANTYPESKNNNLNGVDIVNSMLRRLFSNGDDSKHVHRACELRRQDTCTSLSPGFPKKSADCEEFCWSRCHGSREERDFMLLDYGCTSSGSKEIAKWSGDYGMSPDRSSVSEHIHYNRNIPYHISDYAGRRSPWTKYLPSHLRRETFMSHTSSDIVSQHPDDLPSKQNLLLGWHDEKTEDEDRLQIAPYKFDYGTSLHTDFELRKNVYQLGEDCDSSLSRIQPRFFSGHHRNMDRYFNTTEETDSYLASNHFLEDMENKSWNIIYPRSSSSYVTDTDGDSDFPCKNNQLFLGTPDNYATQECIHTDYLRGQIMRMDQPWEVCENPSSYLSRNCHRCTDGDYQIGYNDEPIYDQATNWHLLPLDT